MKLSTLVDHLPEAPAPEVLGLSADSRGIEPGFLFAALPGTETDGTNYIDDAIGQGAVAVLAATGTQLRHPGVALITDDNPRRRYAELAARFYPRVPEVLAAVTGTNGKTSVAWFTRQIWQHLDVPAASLGTLGLHGPEIELTASLTTPEPVLLHRLLSEISELGIGHVAMEASSHGLDQFRLDGLRFKAAAFTNLSHDHLDYHGTETDYLAAKRRLFADLLLPGGTAVLNADEPQSASLADLCRARGADVVSFGVSPGADLRIANWSADESGQTFDLAASGMTENIHLDLFGAFQAMNAVCALALVVACGAETVTAAAALPGLAGAPGRMERVARTPDGGGIFVDYAHTPAALHAALEAARDHTAGQLSVVFGCGGDRDREKRAPMGRIAAELADHVIVTDDNPRTEDAAEIRAEILSASPGASELADRAEAIHRAATDLDAGDSLLIAGKGHESGQIVNAEVRPFDDCTVAREAAANLAGDWS